MNRGDELIAPFCTPPDPWTGLRSLTAARIALGRAGASAPTKPMLDFQLAHARARDAVHAEFDPENLKSEISNLKSEIPDVKLDCLVLHSAATDAKTFLLRPDLGRSLSEESKGRLIALQIPPLPPLLRGGQDMADAKPVDRASALRPDLTIIVSDGLSPLAVQRHTVPLLRTLLPSLTPDIWRLTPLIIACRGRVAIEDEIGELLGAGIALILIGERPGLGSPDSLGAYMVYGPRVGLTDVNRNCVSNIRPEGLGFKEAARTLHYLLTQARQHRLSGVGLKDNSTLLAETPPSATPELPS